MTALSRAVLELFTFPKPLVVAVNGHAIAGGCVLALQAGSDVLLMPSEVTGDCPEVYLNGERYTSGMGRVNRADILSVDYKHAPTARSCGRIDASRLDEPPSWNGDSPQDVGRMLWRDAGHAG